MPGGSINQIYKNNMERFFNCN